ncbi:hypothetical protein JYU34_017649 [Plutella xylostella]|uniref:Uncharacterized protein n=1 Tax=Plutella xylostella TaxID=51655 RepID=A0ABQ7Q2G5_PLUXY|nr:hypothetical protein JYU34_017649 [Plutella xylostella]
MDGNEGDPSSASVNKKKRPAESSGGGEDVDNNSYSPFLKQNYIRLYPDNSTNVEFKVFVESADKKDKLGNKSPIYLNHIFTTDIKGVIGIHRVNANQIAAVFKQSNNANNFITNATFLAKHQLRAYIPAAQIEKTGIIRFVPTNIYNKELYNKLSSTSEIIAIRRFTKKVGQETIPLQCFKFNHSAKVCNGKQRCSCCAGEHHYKECSTPDEVRCCNCSGPHLAISKSCPIKLKKIMEKKSKITYASAAASKQLELEVNFPPLPAVNKTQNVNSNKFNNKNVNKSVQSVSNNVNKNKQKGNEPVSQDFSPKAVDLKTQLINNDDLVNVIVSTLIQLGNKSDDNPITTSFIKELLFKNLT